MCEHLQVIFGGFLGVLLDDVLFLSMILSHLVNVWLDGVLGRFDSFLDVSEKVSVSCLSPKMVAVCILLLMHVLHNVADEVTLESPFTHQLVLTWSGSHVAVSGPCSERQRRKYVSADEAKCCITKNNSEVCKAHLLLVSLAQWMCQSSITVL